MINARPMALFVVLRMRTTPSDQTAGCASGRASDMGKVALVDPIPSSNGAHTWDYGDHVT